MYCIAFAIKLFFLVVFNALFRKVMRGFLMGLKLLALVAIREYVGAFIRLFTMYSRCGFKR